MDSSSVYVKRHQISDENKKYKCEKCEKKFNTKEGHKFHLETNQCDIDDFTIDCENDKKLKYYKCNICHTSFLSKKDFIEHYNSAHKKEKRIKLRELLAKNNLLSHKCEICQKLFRSEIKLKQHGIWHGERKYKCDICHVMFPTQGFLNSHRSQKHFPKIYSCRWNCGQTFNNPSNRSSHERAEHYLSEQIDEYKCSTCFEVFQSRSQFMQHRKN